MSEPFSDHRRPGPPAAIGRPASSQARRHPAGTGPHTTFVIAGALEDDRRVRRWLDELITQRSLVPGDRLPAERELAERLAVPRGAVRRVLARLEQDGRVTRTVGRGTHLTRWDAPADGLPETSAAALMQARAALEPTLAALAASAARPEDLDRLHHLVAVGSLEEDYEKRMIADALMHRSIARATHNAMLVALYDTLDRAWDLPVWSSLKRGSWTPERAAVYHRGHVAVVVAISARDPRGAHAAMVDHLRRVGRDVVPDPDDPWLRTTDG